MLITQLKPKDEISSLAKGKAIIINCAGCREVYFPQAEATEIQSELLASSADIMVVTTDYICNPENLELQLQTRVRAVGDAETILVFSCGAGVQTVAERFKNVKVFAACDTYPLPGYQGVTPLEYDCALCGECHLNSTGGICPITACSKSLVNGQCGGSKNGKCEVDNGMECGWERIYRRLETLEPYYTLPQQAPQPVRIRDYSLE